jgi:succinate dehydrogenase cytochrome b556 subunit
MPDQTKSNRRAGNWLSWFDLRGLDTGSFAFMMNRISGLGLAFYLVLHLIALSQLATGPQAYDGFIALVKNPIFTAGELIVILAVLLHGLNGVRLVITSLGWGSAHQKEIFYGLMTVAVIGCVVFAVKMFGGA